jgi:putative Holliday junction resolvase
LLVKINELVQEYEPVKFYIGEPKQLSGADSLAAEKAIKFAERLSAKFDIEISMVDERLSTVSASRQLRDAGVDAKSAKTLIDSAAAVAILEQGLALDKR